MNTDHLSFLDKPIAKRHIVNMNIDENNIFSSDGKTQSFKLDMRFRGEKFEYIHFYDIFDEYKKDEFLLIRATFNYNTDFHGQQAAFAFCINGQNYKICIGRYANSQSEFSSLVIYPNGGELKTDLITFTAKTTTAFDFLIYKNLIKVIHRASEQSSVCVFNIPLDNNDIETLLFGYGLIDNNPYGYHKMVDESVGNNACFVVENIELDQNKLDISSANSSVFLRVKVNSVIPYAKNIKVALTSYGQLHERFSKGFITDDGYHEAPSSIFQRVDFTETTGSLKCGGWSKPIDISFIIEKPVIQQNFTLMFFIDGHNEPHYIDDGNTDFIDCSVEFYSDIECKSLLKSVNYKDERNTLAFFLKERILTLENFSSKVVTYAEYTTVVLENYKSMGFSDFPKAKYAHINGDVDHFLLYYPYDKVALDNQKKIFDLLGVNTLLMYHFPCSYLENPWEGNLQERLLNKCKLEYRAVLGADPYTYDGNIFIKFGDEPHIIPIDALQSSTEGLKEFESFVRSNFYTYISDNVKIPDDIRPLKLSEVVTKDDAINHYMTIWFLQLFTFKHFKAGRDVFHNLYGDKVICGTDAYFAGFNVSPDYFVESYTNSFDIQAHHYGSGDTIGPRQIGTDRFLGAMWKSAAKMGNIRKGLLWFVNRIGSYEGVVLSGISALARGITSIHLYGSDLRSSGWEWYLDDKFKTDAVLAAHQVIKLGARYDEYFEQPQTVKTQVGVVLSRSANIWATAPDNQLVGIYGHDEAKDDIVGRTQEMQKEAVSGFAIERRMVTICPSRSCYDIEIIPEESVTKDFLANYKVIYLTESHLSENAQNALEFFVNNGGTLFLGLEAAKYNELNERQSFIENIIGIVAKTDKTDSASCSVTVGMNGEIWSTSSNYNEEDLDKMISLDTFSLAGDSTPFNAYGRTEKLSNLGNSEFLATFSDNSPAIIKCKLGKGTIIKSAVNLGAAYAFSSSPAFYDFIEVERYPFDMIRTGRTAFYKQDFNPLLTELINLPCTLAGVKPMVKSNIDGLDVGVFTKSNGDTILVLANYSTHTNGFVLELETAINYGSVNAENSKNITMSKEPNKIVLELDIDYYDIIELKI